MSTKVSSARIGRKLQENFKVLINEINKKVITLDGLAIAPMMIHISLDILARFLFNTPRPE
ncbi:hypothetical protein HMEPL2_38570 [Vreelandella aquamarina]|jgi:hypothetical protein|uniref:Uncharacterized protein n=2 Tax=Gammaproteobacteria TaxID=1236 RepID=A0A6F8XI64_9GAMM|nr:MAG: hypothetical protein AXW11_17810 [Marinobacter sp. Hex_13]OLF83470.1 hypothetical protein AWH63_21410 [Marinobacter sp. C18]BCB73506.1 hypothetical protein HMEPL2_38570 [Halomonas meridiana]SFM02788.1 hypothetical protein SAMN04487868_12260 [Marinobacter salarius]